MNSLVPLLFSPAIAGRSRDFAWNAVTDADGQASLTIYGGRQGSGFYQAPARNADGEVVGQWDSIPLNRNRRQVLELTLGGGMRIAGVESLAAAKPVASASGLGPNVPNPFNSTTQIRYRLHSPGSVRLVIYNVLGQPVRTLVDGFRRPGCTRFTGMPATSGVRRLPRGSISRACNTPEGCRQAGSSISDSRLTITHLTD